MTSRSRNQKPKPRPQTVQCAVDDALTGCSWSGSTIEFRELGEGRVLKRAIIEIDRPSTLAYVREQLAKIEAAWKVDLERHTKP